MAARLSATVSSAACTRTAYLRSFPGKQTGERQKTEVGSSYSKTQMLPEHVRLRISNCIFLLGIFALDVFVSELSWRDPKQAKISSSSGAAQALRIPAVCISVNQQSKDTRMENEPKAQWHTLYGRLISVVRVKEGANSLQESWCRFSGGYHIVRSIS